MRNTSKMLREISESTLIEIPGRTHRESPGGISEGTAAEISGRFEAEIPGGIPSIEIVGGIHDEISCKKTPGEIPRGKLV